MLTDLLSATTNNNYYVTYAAWRTSLSYLFSLYNIQAHSKSGAASECFSYIINLTNLITENIYCRLWYVDDLW